MMSYIIRRIFLMIPTLIGIMTICFFISEFVPGGPIDQVRAMLEGGDFAGGGEVSSRSGGPRGMDAAKRRKIDPKDEMRLLRQYGYHTTRTERFLRTILWFSPDSIISSKEIDNGEGVYFTAHGRKCIVVRNGSEYTACEAYPYLGEQPVERSGLRRWLPWGKTTPLFGAEIYYDKAAGVLRDIADGANTYALATGKRLTGSGPDLKALPLKSMPVERAVYHDLAYAPSSSELAVPETATPEERPFLAVAQQRPLNLLSHVLLHEAREQALTKDGSLTVNEAGEVTIVNVEVGRTVQLTWNPTQEQLTVRDKYTDVYLNEKLGRSLSNWENWHGYFLLKFGRSIHYNRPSYELILERLPVSIRLGVLSFFITYIGCIVLGIIKAVRHQTRFDTWSSIVVLIGYSIPGFVLAVFMLSFFSETESAFIHLFPTGRVHAVPEIYEALTSWGKFWNNVHHMLAPAICLTIGSFAVLTMFTKNNILNENNQLYAVAARARGLSERKVLYKHILRNAFVPLVTGFPSSFLMMFFTGSLLIEKIFNLPGIGLLGYTAIMGRDYPVVMGNLFMFGVLGLFAQLLTDIGYVIADPRISFDASKA